MNSVVKFYRKIYNQELNQSKRLHLQSGRILKQYFISKNEELLNEEYPLIPIDDKIGEEVYKFLELRGSEIELKYYSLLRVSRFVSLNKYESTRAYPLFEFDAKISSSENGYFISVDLNSMKVIKSNLPASVVSNTKLKKLMLSKKVDLHFVSEFQSVLKKEMEDAKTDELLMFPKLLTKRKLNRILKSEFKLEEIFLAAGVLGIVERKNDSYTTLEELKELEKTSDYSAPLNVIFNGTENTFSEKRGILCEELNTSQDIAITNGNEKIVSVVSGPPGTGKSFTISNIAAEKVSKGQSVLITSKNKEALEVIDEKINEQLGIEGLCVNPTRDNRFIGLKKHLDFLLGRKYKAQKMKMFEIENYYSKFQAIHDKYIRIEKDLLSHLEIEKNYVQNAIDGKFGSKISDQFVNRIIERRGVHTIPLWEKLVDYYNGLENQKNYAVKLIRKVNQFMIDTSIVSSRTELRNYQSFLRATAPNWKKEKEDDVDFDVVLKTFPVWLVKANEISKVISYKKEMFDVLIIDEASQCDIPSLIPLMQRAKRCIIVGDQQQLSHISFIPKAFESSLRRVVSKEKRHLCQHRDNSILDLVLNIIDPIDCTQLNEHFRSQFPIISFSNHEFYDSNLNILTKRPISSNRHVEFTKIKGTRLSGKNTQEVSAVLKKIKQTISDEKDLPEGLKTSIGILSPFRKQVDAMFNEIRKNFTIKEIQEHKILVGTAFSFQGNERDMMLLSLCLDSKSLSGSFIYLNRNDVFNVSITRARNSQFIFYSFDEKLLKNGSTIESFFRFYKIELKDDVGAGSKDEFCTEVSSELSKNGFSIWKKFELSGTWIDILICKDQDYIGIDLIGFPGEMEDYYSLERYKMLQRGKVRIFPLPYALWLADREKCIKAICDLLK